MPRVERNPKIVEDEIRTKGGDVFENKGGQPPILLTKILYYIKDHPNCTRGDLYKLGNEADVRATVIRLLKSRRIKETLTINME